MLMLTEEDIKKVWKNIKILSIDNILDWFKYGDTKPVILSNGYQVSLSLDILSEKNKIYNLSISNLKGITDPKIADAIANEILGEGFWLSTIGTIGGCFRFMKGA